MWCVVWQPPRMEELTKLFHDKGFALAFIRDAKRCCDYKFDLYHMEVEEESEVRF